MFSIETGSYVTHAKMPELGAGEVLSTEKGAVRIRFASGERSFSVNFAGPHLTVTTAAPEKPAATKTAAKRKPRKKA